MKHIEIFGHSKLGERVTDYSNDEQQRRRYLLGDLSEAQRTSVEEEYFTDDDAFERLLAAEHDLVDDYVRGTLPPTERERAEEWVGKDKAKVAVAKALMQWKAGTADTARARLPSPARSRLP